MDPNGFTTKEVRSVISKPPEFDQEINLLIAAGWSMLGRPVEYDEAGTLRVTMVRREANMTSPQAKRNFRASGNTSFRRGYGADGR